METARRAADAMWAEDRASRALGMTVDAVGPAYARLSMTIREDMTNGHGIAHGGFIFALADSAFAFACNATGQRAVANQCQITYLRPAKSGDRLTAEANERYREGRQGITDVTITTSDGTVIAEFRGHSRTIPGSLLDDDAASPTSA
ncbi:hydroxyphenylacetyl-CoA thioesterase PaaI [Acuticoccus sp. M5D2P5]|uniref:hydroxyphenylacetyl-CoA thioesterase PaaI n=1 Tax=Acuticoccus kalidii TaxID=2910977 RepID=UPI001F39CA67|nr:hydroxyphenylacetyl-CoA thioesterase PaaI [Acuticoccus kalidii]MCF3936316.1 hydroxyphenylacetyl-CoA thioesterase PaaI [Acuticoccus kalidii]